MAKFRLADFDYVSDALRLGAALPGRNGGVAAVLADHMTEHPHRCGQEMKRYHIDWYRGTRCPVGLLFNSRLYQAPSPYTDDNGRRLRWCDAVEGTVVYDEQVQALIRESIGWVPNPDMLYDFQQIHDNLMPHLWPSALAVARGRWL
jgi:hypothetical protein